MIIEPVQRTMSSKRDLRGRYFMREKEQVKELLSVLDEQQVEIDPVAIVNACKVLSDDWLTLWGCGENSVCNLSLGVRGTMGVSLFHWLEVIQSLFDLREVKGIGEQARRLNLVSHERLDTALVIIVAGRYRRHGFDVSFEPNGRADVAIFAWIEMATFTSR